MKFASHPVWLAGFRPFFTLAVAAGILLPAVWAAIYGGVLSPPVFRFTIIQWHAHEMFFGFGWAVLGGFLLTATKNWVGIRGYHGGALVYLAGAWLFERAGMWFGASWPLELFLLSNFLFLVSIVGMLVWTLGRHRRSDSYRDDWVFVLALPLFLPAKLMMLSADGFQLGVATAIALFRVAFLVMLERTLTQFMKGVFQAEILRHPMLDGAIKTLGLALAGAALLPSPAVVAADVALALMLLGRFAFWQPHRAMRRLDIGIMYLGYLAIVLQLLLDALDRTASPGWVGTVTVHVFTLGAIGLVAPSLMIRISKGHTGRKVAFERSELWVLRIMLLSFILRIVAPQIDAGDYAAWIWLTATCWCACFAWLGWRLVPFLWQPRVDGREH